MKTSILIVGTKGSELTAYLNKILALLPEGSYCDGKNLKLTENTKLTYCENVKCSFIDAILANEYTFRHIFTTSEKIDKVNAMRNRSHILVFDLSDKFLLESAIANNFSDFHVCSNCGMHQSTHHKICVECHSETFLPFI